MRKNHKERVVLVTGSAGFIGFHISKYLLDEGCRVIGLDSLSEYYDVSLKKHRERILRKYQNYHSIHRKVEDFRVLRNIFEKEAPNIVIHLAAQAGVRYSIDNPRTYLESNILGTFELLEAAREFPPDHILLASTSSIYGANKAIPFKELDRTDFQLSFYAATKKSTEHLAHSYSHLFGLPITMFRLFTVYGPWGRPDMALFKFTDAIIKGKKIDIYNHGDMKRDFTYIDDIIQAIRLLIDNIPTYEKSNMSTAKGCSPVAPFRVLNIGASKSEKLTDFIELLEKSLGREAIRNPLPMQAGDVHTTWADTSLLEKITGYRPNTSISEGVSNFVKWYRAYYKI